MVTSDLGACEWFVWDLRRSGLIDRGHLDTIVGEFLKRNPRAEAPSLAEYLVDQGTITAFQAERVLNGKTQGLVLGPFVLLDAIGAGSMGQVYRASSKNDECLYAVKVLPRRNMWNVRLARRQVRSFSNFSHPAVVPFMDVGTAGGLHYLVWPLVEGVTLEAIVQEQGKLPVNQAVLYAMQIAQGLAISHQNRLFHGLLKPSNVIIGPDNPARILDFGIGSLLVENDGESLVDTMSTANTLTSGLDCASPESIMEPTNRTPAGDQYSLGCVLYYCLTGRVPFPEGSAVEKMMAHQTKEPTPIRELAPEVPEKLAEVVKKLMAKSPDNRYSGCDVLGEALQPFLGDLARIPGGMPLSNSGPVPVTSLRRSVSAALGSSGRMAGISSQPPGSHPGAKVNPPGSHGGTKASPVGSQMAMKSPVASGSRPGLPPELPPSHSASRPGIPPVPPTRTPPPANGRGPELPNRAAIQTGAGDPAAAPEPAAKPSRISSWISDETIDKKAILGPIGLIGSAAFIMVVVYLMATTMMK